MKLWLKLPTLKTPVLYSCPAKPNLIDQVSVLVEKPLSVNEQSAALKKLRAEFNSLGKHDTEEDKALNEVDALCEKAFEPCRRIIRQKRTTCRKLSTKIGLPSELVH